MAEQAVVATGTAVAGSTPAAEESWRALVAEWKASGVSQSRFCRERGLSRHRFGTWKVALEGRDGRGGARLVRVRGLARRRRDEEGTGGAIRIVVGGRFVVELSGRVDSENLARVLDVLVAR